MRTFIIKVLLVVFPVLLCLGLLEIHYRNKDLSFSKFQKEYIEKNKGKIEGIILGPSHIWNAINPEFLSYNTASLALPGSAVNTDLMLLNSVKDKVKPKFILYDLSRGYLENYNGPNWISQNNLYYYYNISSHFQIKNLFYLKYPLWKYYKDSDYNSKLYYNKWGFEVERPEEYDQFQMNNYNDSIIANSRELFKTLLNHNFLNEGKYHANIESLKEIVQYCKSEGVKIIFVSPPKYHLYNEKLLADHKLRREPFISEVVDNETVFFFDFEKEYEKEPTLFYNMNHMNFEGAKLFTEQMDSIIFGLLNNTNSPIVERDENIRN